MNGNKRNFSLSIWDHKDNFICNLKSANSDFEGQSYNENFVENINGEKTLSFSVPMYIFSRVIDEENKEKFIFKQNEVWRQIKNEQKIRYIEYNLITNKPEKIEEFVLKEFTESREGEQKFADCVCESLAIYELGKVGWAISFNTDYITDYELGFHKEGNKDVSNCLDLLTLDYWVKKILYKETNLGKVSTTTECTYLLQGLQLRDDEGYPISDKYTIEKSSGKYLYERINEPICNSVGQLGPNGIYYKYLNPTGWSWKIEASFENDPNKQSISTLYEAPVINQFNQVSRTKYVAQSYQKRIKPNYQSDDQKILRIHPIPENELDTWTYVTEIKKRLLSTERSNVYSIIQDLCETFEVWADFKYEYDINNGKITKREIVFKTESIDDNIKFDFAYGKNLKSCSRNYNSNDLITKLYVANTESELVDGNILTIQQATANPTGENYIYNFDYFYNAGMLSKESDKGIDSDEYKINTHYGMLRNINNRIINLQKFLTPLYTRKNELDSELTIQQAAKIGYMDNIQSIQNKIDAIPANEQVINSWSKDNNQYNHVGDLKTYSTTTDEDGTSWYYLDFGRDDIIVSTFNYYEYSSKDGSRSSSATRISGFTPRAFKYNKKWYQGDAKVPDDNTEYFDLFLNDYTPSGAGTSKYIYSDLGSNSFIKGIKIVPESLSTNYGRIRYKYAPLAYYYLLIKDYWDKIKEVQEKIDKLQISVNDINNKILAYDLELRELLKNKKELILQFEREYKPFIREGYWEPAEYKSQLSSVSFWTGDSSVIQDPFNGLEVKQIPLSELNLNSNNYTHYYSLANADQIDINSIELKTNISISGIATMVPWYRGNGFELFFKENTILIAASSVLTEKYPEGQQTLPFIINYNTKNGTSYSNTFNWSKITTQTIDNYSIYIAKDNIITNKLEVYGGNGTNNLLNVYEDYSYQYDSTAYNINNERIDPSKEESYNQDFSYKYSLKIDLKITNNVFNYIRNNSGFTVVYAEETTLQYIYNDAVGTSKKYSTPQVQYNISVVDLSSLNGYEIYKPKLGQKVPINDVEMGFNNFEGFITSISYSLEEKYNTEITIATYNTKFEDVFQKLTATVTNISFNQNGLFNAANAFEVDGTIKTDVFRKSLEDNFNRIALGTNNDITIDKQTGITLKDVDSGSGVKLIGNGIFLTDDITKNQEDIIWRTGITGEGINANAITAGNIDTKQINIWNASEQQIRFVWNDQGLFAYGDKFSLSTNGSIKSISTQQDLIDYNKFVKFNQNGLEFQEGDRSALRLNWAGLNITAQNGALELNATNGLTLQDSSNTRLILGRMGTNNSIYGLRLNNTSGNTTLQSDSNGNLWLAEKINVGGSFNTNTNLPVIPDAGVYGIASASASTDEMGPRRNENGTVVWDKDPIRFWAGPRNLDTFILEEPDFSTVLPTNTTRKNSLSSSPALARFKVSKSGRIVASGIDVGGWIGGGTYLRSKSNEAILRSDGYGNNDYPVLAIGKSSTKIDGTDYNFKVYKDGSINITSNSTKSGNVYYTGIKSPTNKADIVFYTGTTSDPAKSEFRVSADGTVVASKLTIQMNQVTNLNSTIKSATTTINSVSTDIKSLSTNIIPKVIAAASTSILEITNNKIVLSVSTVGGYTNTSAGLTTAHGNYHVGMRSPTNQDDVVFYAGTDGKTLTNNAFYVTESGYVKANDIHISGGSLTIGGLKSSDFNATNGYTGKMTNPTGTIAGLLIETKQLAYYSSSTIANGDSVTTCHFSTGIFPLGKDKLVFSAGEFRRTNTKNNYNKTQTPAFRVYGDGKLYATDAELTGKITAKSGTIGGLTIGASSLTTGTKTSYSGSGTGIFINKNGIGFGSNFYSSSTGAVSASNITISGGSITIKDGTTEKFKVTNKGAVTANDITINGGSITIKDGTTENFKVTNTGLLTANGATISGKITAKSGNIGGFTVGATSLTTDKKTAYNDTKSGVYVGTNGIGLGSKFYVSSDGDVIADDIYFTGTISATTSGKKYTGVTSNTITISGASGWHSVQIVKGLIVGIRSA